jgi:hypothetical protein
MKGTLFLYSNGFSDNYIPVSSAGYITALLGNKIDTAILHIDQAYVYCGINSRENI